MAVAVADQAGKQFVGMAVSTGGWLKIDGTDVIEAYLGGEEVDVGAAVDQ